MKKSLYTSFALVPILILFCFAPTSNELTISSKSEKQPLSIRQIQILDRLGNIRKSVKADGGKQYKIKIGDLPSGNYFIKVFDGKEWITETLIKN